MSLIDKFSKVNEQLEQIIINSKNIIDEGDDDKKYGKKLNQAMHDLPKSTSDLQDWVNNELITAHGTKMNEGIKMHMLNLLGQVDTDLKNIQRFNAQAFRTARQCLDGCTELRSSITANIRQLYQFCDALDRAEAKMQNKQTEQTSKEEQPKNAVQEEHAKETASKQDSAEEFSATYSASIMGGVEYTLGDNITNSYPYQEENEINQNDAPADLENPENNDVQNSENENSDQTQKRGYYTSMELEDLMKRFASVHSNFYNKDGKHTKEEIAEKRRVNYAMKKIIDKKIDELATNRKNKLKDENLIKKIKDPDIDPKDIDALVKNELAVAKLFKIQATGVYEKNGQSIKLSQKQRTAIASVLVKVCEKQDEIEQTKVDEKAAGKAAAKGVAKQVNDHELGGEE